MCGPSRDRGPRLVIPAGPSRGDSTSGRRYVEPWDGRDARSRGRSAGVTGPGAQPSRRRRDLRRSDRRRRRFRAIPMPGHTPRSTAFLLGCSKQPSACVPGPLTHAAGDDGLIAIPMPACASMQAVVWSAPGRRRAKDRVRPTGGATARLVLGRMTPAARQRGICLYAGPAVLPRGSSASLIIVPRPPRNRDPCAGSSAATIRCTPPGTRPGSGGGLAQARQAAPQRA